MIERVFAAIVLVACAALLLRLVIGARRRHRLDAALRRVAMTIRRGARTVWRWRASRRDAERARKLAEEAISRARRRGEWDGNVYKPKSFRKQPPRDKMH